MSLFGPNMLKVNTDKNMERNQINLFNIQLSRRDCFMM